jgi:hypothetical protein
MEIIARRDPSIGMGPNALHNYGLYKFTIKRSYKGQETGEVVIASLLGGGSCGVLFEVGSDYIVFARAGREFTDSYLETNICTGTDILYAAQAQIAYLRGEVHSEQDFVKLMNPMFEPTGTNASIAGRIRGFQEASFTNHVQAWRIENGGNKPCGITRVSMDGRYEIPVRAGSYIIRALKPGADRFKIGYYPSGHRMDNAIPVEVLPGKRLDGVDFDVREPPTYSVSGIVKNPLGPMRSFEKIIVMLSDRDQMTHLPSRYTYCRSNGTFEIRDVYPGRYHVELRLRFDETNSDRVWKAEVPVIRIAEQTEGIVVNVHQTGLKD